MTDVRKHKLKVFMELERFLTPEIIQKLTNALEIPARINEIINNDPIKFLNAMKNWDKFNPAKFDQALGEIGKHIQQIARKLKWLSNPNYKPPTKSVQIKPVETFVKLLTDELTIKEWGLIVDEPDEVERHSMLKTCVEDRIITQDLNYFCEILEIVHRNDIAAKVRKFKSTFQTITTQDFREQIHQEIELDRSANSLDWELRLRKYLKTQNKDVSVVFDEASVSIESVFTPLTVIKVKPAEERMREESGINEIDFLRNIHEKVEHNSVEVVDLESVVNTSDSSENKVWCLIGNPGSGKSFLCKHFAYLYGIHELKNFRFAISIPCRNEEWHKLEEVRQEKEKVVDPEFIVSWLSLSMSIGAKWSESLSQHLLRSDGEGLLIIMDGADEFIRNIPFESTLLCKILERRFLTLSTILVTSRPSAWTELLFKYGTGFKIDHNFQVLGFSPENRDLYFEKRIETEEKLNSVHLLFHRYDEIKQLALVPVNASLFSALFNQSDSILSHTLSHLYTQLIVYIIRRQLSRMGLKEYSKALQISDFHPAIRKCIHTIGLEANQGIFERQLTSEKYILLKIDGKIYDSERLGLMQAHMKLLSFGRRVRVWTFQHLTIQEFMSALSICDNSWPYRFMIIRYFASSTQYLAMYKMVVRFVCGILRRDAGGITPILCRHAIPVPLSLQDAPMSFQLRYIRELVDVSGWVEFTQSFLLLCTVIIENNSDTTLQHFSFFQKSFSYPLCLFFNSTISPNEWHCFIQSLKYLHKFHIIQIHSDFVTKSQFHSLLTQLATCDVIYLALFFVEKSHNEIHPYTNTLNCATLAPNTKVSIHLHMCDLSACDSSKPLFSSANQFVGSLMLYDSVMEPQMLKELTNHFSSLQNLFYKPKSSAIDQSITSIPINGLCIRDFNSFLPVTPSLLSGLSSLTELEWTTKDNCYKVLPYLRHNSSLTQLSLFSHSQPSDDSHLNPLTELISSNSNSLRDISLPYLHKVGFHSWETLFNVVTSCSNLMVLRLWCTELSSDDISCWYNAVSALNSLIDLLLHVPLQDSGMLVLCHSLSYHPAIRWLEVYRCQLSSASCMALKCLILTLRHLKILNLYGPELASPDTEPLQLLILTAEQCSIKIELRN